MLLFKRHLLPLITSGKKRQTIRLWKSPRVRPGQIAFAPGLGRLLITAIDQIPSLATLTAADARADGFPTKKALLAEIRRLYHPLPKERHIYRIKFEYPAPKNPSPTPSPNPTPIHTPTPALSLTPKAHPRRKSRKSKPTPPKSTLTQQRQTLRHFLISLAPK